LLVGVKPASNASLLTDPPLGAGTVPLANSSAALGTLFEYLYPLLVLHRRLSSPHSDMLPFTYVRITLLSQALEKAGTRPPVVR